MESALLATICVNPSLDAPRLVYADWLEETGRTDRAAFIRDGCSGAQVVDYRWLYRQDWLVPLLNIITDGSVVKFDRGFPYEIMTGGNDFVRHAPKFTYTTDPCPLTAVPMTNVRLTSPPRIQTAPVNDRTYSRGGMVVWEARWWEMFDGVNNLATFCQAYPVRDIEQAGGDLRRKFLARIDNARTPLGYLQTRWPGIEFTL